MDENVQNRRGHASQTKRHELFKFRWNVQPDPFHLRCDTEAKALNVKTPPEEKEYKVRTISKKVFSSETLKPNMIM